MLSTFVTVMIGYSIISLLILLMAYVFFLPGAQRSAAGIGSCTALTAALVALQIFHLHFMQAESFLIETGGYLALLLMTPPSFYLFSRSVLLPEHSLRWMHLLHFAPVSMVVWLPSDVVLPTAFAIGVCYSLWIARLVNRIRRYVARFRFEMFFFGMFAVLAVAVLLLVLAVPWVKPATFVVGYSQSIALAVVLVAAALLIFPEILVNVSDSARAAYVASTLGGVDVVAVAKEIERLFDEEHLHRNENLNLTLLSKQVGLTTHQVSELVNSHFGVGVSRYIREKRVADAQRVLANEGRSSVLAIGMMVGFGSQSSFYAAFREIAGESPAAFRKRQAAAQSPK